MSSLWYLLDFTLALPLLLNGFYAFFAALGVSVLISFSMRGYEGITLSDPEKQKASALGSAFIACLVALITIFICPFVALPAIVVTLFRYFFLYRLVRTTFVIDMFMLVTKEPIQTTKAYDRLKRILDVVFATLMLLILGPVIGIVAFISLFTGGRPIFICQTRIGKNCDKFGMYKFRTFKTEDGKEQITKLGRFLRPLRLDELPQIINIIRGDMSLVGPRPELPSFHKLGMENIENYSLRLLVKPGLTGWAQINYKYTTTLEEYRIKTAFDLYYVKHRSLILDLKCLFKTPFAVFITLLKREG